MSMIGFPLLLIPLAVCNIIVFLMPGVSFAATVVTVPLMSGVSWAVTLSDVLLALGILLLLFEVIKGARPGGKYVTDHLLSLIVFGAAAAEFLLLPQFGTSTYFLLVALALVDFMSGIGLRTRRRKVAVPVAVPVNTVSERDMVIPEPAIVRTPVASEPVIPEPAAPLPTAEPVAESVLRDPPDPAAVRHDIVADAPSPQVQSPGIQPNSVPPNGSETPPR